MIYVCHAMNADLCLIVIIMKPRPFICGLSSDERRIRHECLPKYMSNKHVCIHTYVCVCVRVLCRYSLVTPPNAASNCLYLNVYDGSYFAAVSFLDLFQPRIFILWERNKWDFFTRRNGEKGRIFLTTRTLTHITRDPLSGWTLNHIGVKAKSPPQPHSKVNTTTEMTHEPTNEGTTIFPF